MPDEIIRRDDRLLSGRLVAMSSTLNTAQKNVMVEASKFGLRNLISIDFPAMPDVIELARSADYYVNYNIIMPDGIHQYRGTKPMEIPVSFTLHAMDQQYCKKGALTLLQLAARLHSFVLPISTFSRGAVIAPQASSTQTAQNGGQPNAAQLQAQSSQDTIYSVVDASVSKQGGIFNPVTCWLHLMWTSNEQPGISAVGYVRDVRVKFKGPWMRGPNNSFNLPTSADFEFTFIHRPGHGNATPVTTSEFPPTVAESGQAFADDVKDRLYNTRDLVHAAKYQGFATDPISSLQDEPPPEATPTAQGLTPPLQIPQLQFQIPNTHSLTNNPSILLPPNRVD